MLIVWLAIFFVPPAIGYLLGKLRPSKWRLGLLVLFVVAPPLVLTALMASARPAPGGFFLWWWIGMGVILLPEIIWAIGTFVGFSVAKRKGN
jgi:hypothetical protein